MAVSSSSSSLMAASQTLILSKHTFLHTHKPSLITLTKPKSPISSKPLQFSSPNPKKTLSITASKSPVLLTNSTSEPLLTGSTRTITTLIALSATAFKVFANKFANCLAVDTNIQKNVIATAGPLFFATMSGRPARLHTPLTVVAAGMAKWLDIYSGVLLVRVLLSWFPNIPWDRQPLSAIRDLCDPYLNLFRNIIPPVFDTLDVSPLLAFAVLGFLAGILKNSRMGY